jgi:hypothetical protein
MGPGARLTAVPLSDDDVREIIAILERESTGELRISSGALELHVVRTPPGAPATPSPPTPA